MQEHKSKIGGVLGLGIAVLINSISIEGLSAEGQLCLSLSLMTVIFWGFQISHNGYISGLYLALLIVFQVAEPDVVLAPLIESTIYLVIGAYLIASAVKASGLGNRIAYMFILKYVDSYKDIIISIFVLTFILSLLIPHPWPRAFLILAVMVAIIKNANLPKEDGIKIGFTVFAASVPVSTIFLTGDSVVNPLAVEFAGMQMGWIDWLIYMGVPGVVSSTLTCILILKLFKPSSNVDIDKTEIQNKITSMGALTSSEIRVIVWLSIAIVLWMTDFIHGIALGWITLLIAMLMSFPGIGEVLKPKDWGEVPVQVLIFLTAAIAIGRVGAETGMNDWIAQTLLPAALPSNVFILGLFIAGFSILIHMVLGSVIAVMGIVIPSLIAFTQGMDISPIVVSLIAFTTISTHYILPFHHLNLIVGLEKGGYSDRESMRLGLLLTIVVIIVILLVQIPWWNLIGVV